ncbi:hypothetical protein ANME2D_02367 [Candidatus Methanoperedens nitroreducens]|uniref:CopG family transcriptional regulator n=1 Tax=Candidatus Methanoperedens nitratireducens TaxID=1392998 RepID=A0A062V2N5_9EURY|nr:hypothetical protein [Candidatus Methanoperedens nitroreducens]KCZ71632.1 hypothetical protein ANME2D_02367 [Candidatus Methanoperedens nitroreducens]MDJ1421260.1 hypothetical protein [Candidatus Methanoperedens sp.]
MQFSQKRLKETTSITINKYLLDKSKELVEKGEFGSVSDVITTALSEFFVSYEAHKKTPAQKPQETDGAPLLTRPVTIG